MLAPALPLTPTAKPLPLWGDIFRLRGIAGRADQSWPVIAACLVALWTILELPLGDRGRGVRTRDLRCKGPTRRGEDLEGRQVSSMSRLASTLEALPDSPG